MSGGHFYIGSPHQIRMVVEEIEDVLSKDMECGKYCVDVYSAKTIWEIRRCARRLHAAALLLQRVDYLLCGDYSEDTFHERISEDLQEECFMPEAVLPYPPSLDAFIQALEKDSSEKVSKVARLLLQCDQEYPPGLLDRRPPCDIDDIADELEDYLAFRRAKTTPPT
jgi:hypothetical protein